MQRCEIGGFTEGQCNDRRLLRLRRDTPRPLLFGSPFRVAGAQAQPGAGPMLTSDCCLMTASESFPKGAVAALAQARAGP